MASEVKWQNYLNDATEAFLAGESLESLREEYGIPYQEAHDLMSLVENINNTMIEVQPSKQFSRNLKDELMGLERTGMVWRIRHLPARVQLAALAAILSGFLIILQRFFLIDSDARSENALQEKS
jgi:hypothetical protein